MDASHILIDLAQRLEMFDPKILLKFRKNDIMDIPNVMTK